MGVHAVLVGEALVTAEDPGGEGAGAPGTARARPQRRRAARTRRVVTVVKVCGVKELAPMLAGAEAGADMVGRQLRSGRTPPGRARVRAGNGGPVPGRSSPRCVTVVGLFADQPADEVVRIADEVGVDWVQLCGHEGPETLATGRPPLPEVRSRPGPAGRRCLSSGRTSPPGRASAAGGGCWRSGAVGPRIVPAAGRHGGRPSTGASPASSPGAATASSWPEGLTPRQRRRGHRRRPSPWRRRLQRRGDGRGEGRGQDSLLRWRGAGRPVTPDKCYCP